MSLPETAENILHAARELFAEKGFSNISTRQIARKAGVNEVTLFRHFGTKIYLYEALFEHYGQTSGVYESFEKDSTMSPHEALLAFGQNLYRFFCNNELLIRMELREQSFLEGKTIPVTIIANRNKRIVADYLSRIYGLPEEEAISYAVTFLCSIWGIYMATHVFHAFHPVPDVRACVETVIRSLTCNLDSRKTCRPEICDTHTLDSHETHKPESRETCSLDSRETQQAGGNS